MIKGSCYCGAIEYSVDADLSGAAIACHCQTCQKLHSSLSYNFKTEESKIKVLKGTPVVFDDDKADSKKIVHRAFCGTCHSALWSIPESVPGVAFIKVGTLDDAGKIKAGAEIYVEQCLDGLALAQPKQGIKRFEGMMAKEVS